MQNTIRGLQDRGSSTMKRDNRLLLKIKKPERKTMIAESIISEILTPLLAILLVYLSYWTSLLSEVDSPFMKGVISILILSVAFYNVARGIKKLRESKKDKDDEYK